MAAGILTELLNSGFFHFAIVQLAPCRKFESESEVCQLCGSMTVHDVRC